MNKVVKSAAEAVRDVPDGATRDGVGLRPVRDPGEPDPGPARPGGEGPHRRSRTTPGSPTSGSASCCKNGQVRKMIATYVGENKVFETMFLDGSLEVELNPQGTFAERIRAGGAGHPRLLHARRLRHGGRRGQGGPLVRREALRPGDGRCAPTSRSSRPGRATPPATSSSAAPRRNFGPMMCQAARTTVAEVEQLVPAGALDPDHVHVPGIFVQRIVPGDGLREADRAAHPPRRGRRRRPTRSGSAS